MYTLIISYYNQPEMLQAQLAVIRDYPAIQVMIVDDGSPQPAKRCIDRRRFRHSEVKLSLYRIKEDIPWNRSEARNLGAYRSETGWIIQVDCDHILPADCAKQLLEFSPRLDKWYRFPRIRIGKADSTRKKDQISPDAGKGKIHPHQDSYLIRKDWFMQSPYDERYSGCLGGGTPFLSRMIQLKGEPLLLPDDIYLEVYTMDKIKDASVDLSRDTSEYARRRAKIADACPTQMLMYPWEQVI